MNRIGEHRTALAWAHQLLDMVMADVTPEQAVWQPPGNANSLAATYAHAVAAEDGVVNVLLQGQAPLYETNWAGRTGISEPRWTSDPGWARSVQVDLPAMRAYTGAVSANSEAFLDSLSEEDLDRTIDLTAMGLGQQSLSWCLSALVISHLNNMTGEISVLKGIQGSRGYPF